MQTNIECQICYQWTNEDDFLQMCYNPAHILCYGCSGQVIDQGICPYCRQINPNYTEPFSSSSEEESLNTQFEQSSSESYQPLDEQHSQWVLDNITDTTLITHFIVHNQDRQQCSDITSQIPDQQHQSQIRIIMNNRIKITTDDNQCIFLQQYKQKGMQMYQIQLNDKVYELDNHGTQNEPLVKCSDLMIHVMGYRECSQANWFRKLKTDSRYVITTDNNNKCFTQLGINYVMVKGDTHIKIQKQQYIYVIHCDNLPFIKIGRTCDLKNRLKAYNTSHWEVIVKRVYQIRDIEDINDIEQKCFNFMTSAGCQQKSEKFKLQNIDNLDGLLNQLDAFMSQYI